MTLLIEAFTVSLSLAAACSTLAYVTLKPGVLSVQAAVHRHRRITYGVAATESIKTSLTKLF
jgi:hypothetical protein